MKFYFTMYYIGFKPCALLSYAHASTVTNNQRSPLLALNSSTIASSCVCIAVRFGALVVRGRTCKSEEAMHFIL
jgi:hypothetical protein